MNIRSVLPGWSHDLIFIKLTIPFNSFIFLFVFAFLLSLFLAIPLFIYLFIIIILEECFLLNLNCNLFHLHFQIIKLKRILRIINRCVCRRDLIEKRPGVLPEIALGTLVSPGVKSTTDRNVSSSPCLNKYTILLLR